MDLKAHNRLLDLPPVNILLVDDLPANLLALEGVLEPLGQNLVRANSGEEALKWLLSNDCAVILLDVQMPVLDGFETAGLIKEREKSRHIPIVFVTAVNQEERFVMQGYAAGAVDYILKPFGAEILKSKVAVFVDLFQKTEEIKNQISGRRRTERQLTQSEVELSEFKNTLDATLDGVFMFDAHSMHFSYINYGGVGQLGYDADEILTLTPFDILPQADAETLRDKLSALRNGTLESYTFQTLQRHKDGKDVPVEVFMQFVAPPFGAGRFVAVARDITQRKSSEAALQANEKRFEAFMDNTPALVFIKDVEGRYVYLNRAVERLTHTPVDELLGKTNLDYLPKEVSAQLRANDLLVMSSGQAQRFEEMVPDREGNMRHELVMKFPLVDADGAPLLAGVSVDITERIWAKEALQKSYDELEERVSKRTQELADANALMQSAIKEAEAAREEAEAAREEAVAANLAKSEFLSRMSHELRTPLNAILGFGQILERDDLTPRQDESISHILKGGRHLLTLINEVLDLARVEAGHIELSIEAVALIDVVNECCALLQPLAVQSNIHLINDVPANNTHHVMADRQRLKQVLINLLANAIKYNRTGGEVRVSIRPVAGERLQLRVQDTGFGLASEQISKLFIPFERLNATDSHIEGSGLGLALSERLATVMGATLGVESTVGQGSIFWVELPQVDSPLQYREESPVNTDPDRLTELERAYTVLSIEDNLSNTRLIEAILASHPEITLLSAMQGTVGLDLARQHRPDVILLDLNLPGISGSEVLSQLQQSEETKEIPVVVISADANPSQIEQLLAAGAKAYLTKPIDVDEFLKVLDEALLNAK